MDKSGLEGLLERLEKCEGPDRGIDGLIARDILGWLPHFDLEGDDILMWYEYGGHWHQPDDPCDGYHSVGEDHPDPDEFTNSLDACIALVERVLTEPIACGNKYACSYGMGPMNEAPTPALAFLTAAVKMLIAETENK